MTIPTREGRDNLRKGRFAPASVAGLLLGLFLLAAPAHAGQIYGSIFSSGRGLGNTPIEIDCRGKKTPGSTAADGSYRVNVAEQGQCTLTLPSYAGATATVFSYPNPSQYDFELVGPAQGTYILRRRS